MLIVTTVATSANAHDPDCFGRRLSRLEAMAHLGPDGRFAREVAAERERLRAVPGRPAAFFSIKLSLITATHLDLPSVAQRSLAVDLLPEFPDASLQLLQISSGPRYAVRARRVLLQLEDSHERPDPSKVQPGQPVFGSALHLADGISVGLSPYLSPLLLSHAVLEATGLSLPDLQLPNATDYVRELSEGLAAAAFAPHCPRDPHSPICSSPTPPPRSATFSEISPPPATSPFRALSPPPRSATWPP